MIESIMIGFLAYLVGSVPMGYLVARARGISDIREHGSGSIGATNVSRVLGWPYFILVFLLDFIKAYVFMAVCIHFFDHSTNMIVSALLLLVGNGFPLFLGFKGGKGVATTLGILGAVQPLVVLFLFPLWLMLLLTISVVGFASCATLVALPLVMYLVSHNTKLVALSIGMMIIVLYYHRTHLRKIFISGETKI